MIGRSGERWSRISMLAARHDDNDDIQTKLQVNKIITNRQYMVIICILA